MRRSLPAVLALLSLVLSAVPAVALPTPGLFCEPAEAATGRLFPEAMETNDFVGYEEALCALAVLDARHPERIEILHVADSVGWKNHVTQANDRFQVLVVEVTNEESAMHADDKAKIVFQLSIHGNEKGGREGGFRAIEDLVRGIGLAERRPDLVELLDQVMLVFVLPNPDGWRHEEAPYRANCARYAAVPLPAGAPLGCVESQNFVRGNGNGVDLNRDLPTRGWYHEPYTAMSEPEVVGLVEHLRSYRNVRLASDIHGMLQPANMDFPDPERGRVLSDRGSFVLTMLGAAAQDPAQMETTTALAELVKERLNTNPYFAEWRSLPRGVGAWGGDFNDWGTVWDTIGYTDSGFTSDWYAQEQGLGAPGVSFELAYNHITFDNHYPGLAQRVNAYHVETVRVIVEAFLDQVAKELVVRYDAGGRDTAVLEDAREATNVGDPRPNRGLEGWALENAADDAFDLANADFRARPASFWDDLRPHVANGRLDTVTVGGVAAGALSGYTNLVVTGGAYEALAADAAAAAAVHAWVEAGGTLVVTDDALRMLQDLGLASKVGSTEVYAPYTDFVDPDHRLAADVRGLARQLVEPVPLGYRIRDGGTAPAWYATPASGVEVVGVLGDPEQANLGVATLGAGQVVFLGAFLPTPTREHDHPYGLEPYATTYTANQLLRNALGWSSLIEETPLGAASTPDVTTDAPAGVPGPAPVLAALALLGAALLARRRREA